jgi:LPLT family lysophospholipid transporter-like MFS transporter
MTRSFYTIIAAQFFSSLADSALFIFCVSVVTTHAYPLWMTPMLKVGFVVSYILLAPLAGAFADSMPKGRVMMITNLIKITGCSMMFLDASPLLAYGIVGFGAAVYSPAKYGILTELLPAEQLVKANGWVEGTTVISIILGTVIGGAISANKATVEWLLRRVPFASDPLHAALATIVAIYALAATFNVFVVQTGARYSKVRFSATFLIEDFFRCNKLLWRDPDGMISLGITSLFWGVGMVLQVVLLKWAQRSLSLPLDQATLLQGVFALGIAIGAAGAARIVPLTRSLSVLPVGVAMGGILCLMTLVKSPVIAFPMLALIGMLAGFFVVPMNAMLQHRGHQLMSAGHSIAVQNFNENLAIISMMACYAVATRYRVDINVVIIVLGALLSVTTLGILRVHRNRSLAFTCH